MPIAIEGVARVERRPASRARRGDVAEADHLRQRDRRVVQRPLQGVLGGDLVLVFSLEVTRRVGLAIAEGEGLLLVRQQHSRGKDASGPVDVGQLRAGKRGVECCRVDKRFKN